RVVRHRGDHPGRRRVGRQDRLSHAFRPLRPPRRAAMTLVDSAAAYSDPYDVAINAAPYPVFRRLREEAPLYYNEPHDFFAVSRFEDVERGLVDAATYISGRGG